MIEPVRNLTKASARHLLGIFFDIDDTFSTRGRIPSVAYQTLWDLTAAGLKAVPITGRPAGWCDHIARMWPVDGVVGENGAFYFWMDETAGRLKQRFLDSDAQRKANRLKLQSLADDILAAVPGAGIASDQRYREADLAIDFCEDVAPLGRADVDRICALFERSGATCKVSSIHVNGWFGQYSKLEMTRMFVHEVWGLDLDQNRDRFVFCGDSPNDEPMFEFFPLSVGVKNVLVFSDRMEHLPAYVTSLESGEGFAELGRTILNLRQAPV